VNTELGELDTLFGQIKQQYELTLQAERLAVSGAKFPVIEEKNERLRKEERLGQVRHLIETLDLLFEAFLKRRLSVDSSQELEAVRGWLMTEERGRPAQAG
jgi:hypothetical protein